MAPTLAELRFLRTLTPPARDSGSDEDTDTDYDPYRSPTPENTTGVEFDKEDEVWRCTRCGWEVETIDGVQGYCREGHESDLTRVDGWFSTCEWDVGMWSDQGGEDGSYDGNEGRSEDEYLYFGMTDVDEKNRRRKREPMEDDGDEETTDKEVEDFGWVVEDEDVEVGGDARMADAELTGEAGTDAEHSKVTRVQGGVWAAEYRAWKGRVFKNSPPGRELAPH